MADLFLDIFLVGAWILRKDRRGESRELERGTGDWVGERFGRRVCERKNRGEGGVCIVWEAEEF